MSNEISDVTAVAGLVNLEVIFLEGNPISDTAPLRTLLEKNPNIEIDIDVDDVAQPTDDPEAAWMPDPNLRAAVRDALGLAPSDTLTQQALQGLTRLGAAARQISDLTGLEHATQLTGLGLRLNEIIDISPLTGLTQLTWLRLADNEIRDITPLTGLTKLTLLSLRHNEIIDISPLTSLTQLTSLILDSNEIGNITPLTGLTKLTQLWLLSNEISDISPLTSLTQLTSLILDSNEIGNITPLTGLTKLTQLWLLSNEISDVTAVAGLVNLEVIFLEGNPITDTAPLRTLLEKNPNIEIDIDVDDVAQPTDDPEAAWMPDPNLRAAVRDALGLAPSDTLTQQALQGLTRLGAAARQISDITGLEHATQLTELDLRYNAISDISPLAQLTKLTTLELLRNQISDINPLAGLTKLTRLTLASNQISDVTTLLGLTQLMSLGLARNPITDKTTRHTLLRQNPNLSEGAVGIEIDGIWSVSFSPDGTLLASGVSDNTVKLLDVATRENIATLEGHTDSITSVSFSPDGTLLASGSFDGTVKLWDVVTQENIATLEGHQDSVTSVSFSPDGTLLASGASEAFSRDGKHNLNVSEGTVKFWDVVTKENIDTLSAGPVTSVSFSPDGTLFASGGGEFLIGTLKLWDVATRENITTLEGHTTQIASVSFSSDGALLASASSGIVKVWDMETRENIATLDGNSIDITSVSFSPDGTLLASGSGDFLNSTVELWDVGTRENIATLHGNSIDITSVSFSPDGMLLASGSFDGTVKLWNIAESTLSLVKISGDAQQGLFGSELAEPLVVEVRDRYNNPVQDVQVAFTVTAGKGQLSGESSVEHTITDANGRAERTLTLGHAPTNTVGVSIAERELATFIAVGVSPYQIAVLEGLTASFSPDGSLLATGAFDGTVRLLDVATRETIATLEGPEGFVSVSFSPDGTLLASVSFDGIKLWDVETRENIATLEGSSVSFSPDGSLLVTGAFDGTVKLLDIATRENIATLEGPEGIVSVSFSPDGSLLASGTFDSLKLLDIATGENIATLERDTEGIASVSFSPDGSLLASGTSGGIKLWDMATRENIITLFEGLNAPAVSFSPDGTLLACGLEGGTVLLDMETSWPIAIFEEPSIDPFDYLPVTSVSFSPDGKLLATGSIFFGVKLWDVASYLAQLEPEKLAADVNGDGIVNILDLVVVASNFGQTGKNVADVDENGVVNILDLVRVAGALGNAAAAPSLHPQALSMFTAEHVQKWLSQAQCLNLTDVTSRQGIRYLQQLLAALIPEESALLPNYPNPFNPETWIPYQLAKPGDVTLTVYSSTGEVVRQFSLGYQLSGTYQSRIRAAYWDGKNQFGESVASGIYFYTFTAGDFTATRKMVIQK